MPPQSTCSIDDCERPKWARGWCGAHYARWRLHGDALPDMPIGGPSLTERFWSKVEKTDTCWLWRGCVGGNGYGQFSVTHRKNVGAHRFAYELLVGPIPEGLSLDHLCRVIICVNSSHLEAVPIRINILRGETLAAANAKKTHCAQGHPFDETNTYLNRNKSGRAQRTCRACGRLWCKAWYARKRAGEVQL